MDGFQKRFGRRDFLKTVGLAAPLLLTSSVAPAGEGQAFARNNHISRRRARGLTSSSLRKPTGLAGN